MVIMTGWIPKVVCKALKDFDRREMAMGKCISLEMPDIMVRRPFFDGIPPSSFVGSLTTIQVYLDNHVAVNELLVKELEKEFEGRDHK